MKEAKLLFPCVGRKGGCNKDDLVEVPGKSRGDVMLRDLGNGITVTTRYKPRPARFLGWWPMCLNEAYCGSIDNCKQYFNAGGGFGGFEVG